MVRPGLVLAAGGLATSNTTVRRWRRGELELHHIIDPSNGLPAGGRWRTVTVAAQSCVAANTASTEAIVRGDGAVQHLGLQRLADADMDAFLARRQWFDGFGKFTGDIANEVQL